MMVYGALISGWRFNQPAREISKSRKGSSARVNRDIVARQSALLGAPNRAVYVILLSERSSFWTLRGHGLLLLIELTKQTLRSLEIRSH